MLLCAVGAVVTVWAFVLGFGIGLALGMMIEFVADTLRQSRGR